MRKLKITVAILVVLFACQAVFAGFVPVQKADSAVTDQLRRFCDILQNIGLQQEDPVAFYKDVAGSSDDAIRKIVQATYTPLGYESVTTIDELALIFPRGIEETVNPFDTFRRAAIHLASYTAKNGHMHDTALIEKAEATFSIVGYKYLLRFEDNTIKFDFIDIYSEDDLKAIGYYLRAAAHAGEEILFPEYGEIDIVTSGITEFGFRQLAAFARSLMYSLIYDPVV